MFWAANAIIALIISSVASGANFSQKCIHLAMILSLFFCIVRSWFNFVLSIYVSLMTFLDLWRFTSSHVYFLSITFICFPYPFANMIFFTLFVHDGFIWDKFASIIQNTKTSKFSWWSTILSLWTRWNLTSSIWRLGWSDFRRFKV